MPKYDTYITEPRHTERIGLVYSRTRTVTVADVTYRSLGSGINRDRGTKRSGMFITSKNVFLYRVDFTHGEP